MTVEHRRMRTWAPGDQLPSAPWWTIARYGLLRLVRTWWQATLLVLLGVALVVTLGFLSYSFASGDALSGGDVAGFSFLFLGPSVILLAVVGAPLFAEDLRVHANVFYFSRPIERQQYLAGKLAMLGSLLGAATVAPVLVCAVLLLAVGVPLARIPQSLPYGQTPAMWEALHIDTMADGLYSALFFVAGTVCVLVFLAACFVLASAYTRRGWHAAVAVVAVLGAWGILGGMASEFRNDAIAQLFGPFGWMSLVLQMPQTLRYDVPYWRLQSTGPAYGTAIAQSSQNGAVAIGLAYVLMLLTSLVALGLAQRRVLDEEAPA